MTVPVPGQLTYSYDEDGETTEFAYPLRFLEASELVVIREVGGVQTTLVLNTDYTVAGAGSPSGGSITRDVATDGGRIIITRSTAWKQTVDLQDNARNPADAVEQQLDRLAMAGQDTRHQLEAKADTDDLADVALSGDYDDLLNRPTLGTAAATDATDYATAAQGAAAETAVQPGDLAAVATTGSYNDLSNKPSIPAAQVNSDWEANSGVAEILNKPTLGTMAAEDASDYTKTSGLSSVATSGDYGDLSNTPTLGSMASEDASDYTKTSDLAAVATTNDYEDLDNKPTLGTMAAEDAGDYTKTDDLGGLASKDKVSVSDIDATGTASASTFLRGDGSWAPGGGGEGGGDVFGPDSAVDGVIALFDGTTGKLLKVGSAPFSGAYADLSGKPTLGTAAATDATAYATASQGTLADSAVQPSDLADVATSGDYDDLSNKPTLGTMAAEDASDYAKVADLGDAAALDIGTAAGTVAAGNDSRIVGAVQTSRSVATQHSLTGGGNLSANRTLSLVNDTASPGNNKVYGTDASGVRGWKDDPTGGGFGIGQTWQDVSASRANTTVYQNTTGKPIEVVISMTAGSSTFWELQTSDDGTTNWMTVGLAGGTSRAFMSALVIPGGYYRTFRVTGSGSGTISTWVELR